MKIIFLRKRITETNTNEKLEDIKVLYGDIVTKPFDPVKEGYYFTGWYINKELTGIRKHLKVWESTRHERGKWNLETDIEELTQSGLLTVEYTYVIKNDQEFRMLLGKVMKLGKPNVWVEEIKTPFWKR